MENYRQFIYELEKQNLSKYAQLSCNTKGRLYPIDDNDKIRAEFQRDRDRIIHCKAFRRLKHKTQVFLSPEGDHYRTRLTHTLEVAQIGRTIARALRLNEDLVEAMALGHDLGHTPFGHAGEKKLNQLVSSGFKHADQSLRVVDILENDGKGLNLTYEVRQGIVQHNLPYNETPETLELEIIKYADRFAYINHDIEDAIRGKVLSEEELPKECCEILGYSKSERINSLIIDIVDTSFNKPYIKLSSDVFKAYDTLHKFMYDKVYLNKQAKPEESKAVDILEQVYMHYFNNIKELPPLYQRLLEEYPKDRVIADYISSFTDQYCIKKFTETFMPKYWSI